MSEPAGDVRRRETTYSDPDDVRGPLWAEAVAAGAGRGALVPPGGDPDGEDESAADTEAAGILGRYARWQWRDFWVRRGAWLGLGALLGVWLLTYLAWHGGRTYAPGGARSYGVPMRSHDVAAMAHAFFAFGGALAALLGVGGLVSRERERGLQRFLFAKPVRPVRYYLQAFVINSVAALGILLAAVLLAAALLGGAAVPVGTVLAVGVGAYLLTAGVTFLASALIRFDAPAAAAWLLAGFPVLAAAENHWPGARLLSWLFPQGPALAVLRLVERPGSVGGPGTPDEVFQAGVLIILVAVVYGLLALAGGVAVLRRRAIST